MTSDETNSQKGGSTPEPHNNSGAHSRQPVADPIMILNWLVGTLKEFTSSGLFFMIVGGIMLYVANQTMGTTHSTMSFFLVVIGSAILLFGTGTQAFGQASGDQLAKYTVTLAGGAGLLAFAIAFGVVQAQEKIRKAFHAERKYIKVPIHALILGDGQSDLEKYFVQAFVSDGAVPILRSRKDSVVLLVPYLDNSDSILVDLELSLPSPMENPQLDPAPKVPKLVIRPETKENKSELDGGFDMPFYIWPERDIESSKIRLRKPADQSAKEASERSDRLNGVSHSTPNNIKPDES